MDTLTKKLKEYNSFKFNLLKAAEELQELSLVLTQKVVKAPGAVKNQEIVDEIGDVNIRLKVLEELFGKDEVRRRVVRKGNKIKSYIKSKKYENV